MSLKPIKIRYSPHRRTKAVRVKKIDYYIFHDNTIAILIYTSRGAIYLPPVVDENKIVPLPKKHARGLSKIAPEVKPVPYGVLYTP